MQISIRKSKYNNGYHIILRPSALHTWKRSNRAYSTQDATSIIQNLQKDEHKATSIYNTMRTIYTAPETPRLRNLRRDKIISVVEALPDKPGYFRLLFKIDERPSRITKQIFTKELAEKFQRQIDKAPSLFVRLFYSKHLQELNNGNG